MLDETALAVALLAGSKANLTRGERKVPDVIGLHRVLQAGFCESGKSCYKSTIT